MHILTEEPPPIAAERPPFGPGDASLEAPLLTITRSFVRQHWLAMASISAFLLIPCFWHRYIVAGDLDSHLYNAWLVQLIERGQAPGLWIARQWNNVLFDFMLSNLGNLFDLHAAERIAVSASVLVFFWGVFSLVSAAARRAPWFLVPCLAVLAYGWTFMMGFFNYYLSLGLSFFALALWWRGRGNERLLALALAPLIYLAHPLGLAWLVGAAVYITIAGAVSGRGQILLLSAFGVVLAAVAAFISIHFPGPWEPVPGIAANGTNQALLNSPRYLVPARLWLAFSVIFILADLVGRRREHGVWAQYSLPLQLYTVALMGVSLIPGAFQVLMFATPIMFLTHRLSSLCAALLCCVLGVMKPRRWHLVGFAMMALIYFSHLYNDTASVIRMESQAEQLVATLPDGQRVIPDLWSSSVLVDLSNHIVDRACIGRCFSLSNYEPSSRQFRVRASSGNRIVVSNPGSSTAMQTGSYVVRPEDLPLYQIYLCERRTADLCLRELPVGAIH